MNFVVNGGTGWLGIATLRALERFENNGNIHFNEINPEFFIENIQIKEILNCLIKQIYG